MDILNFLGLENCRDRLQEILRKFRELNLDHHEYTCMKFLILLDSGRTFFPCFGLKQLQLGNRGPSYLCDVAICSC